MNMRALGWLVLSTALAAGCRPETHVRVHKPVEPPVAAAGAIPDGPVTGTLRGHKFVLGDARYVADHRRGYTRVDIALSSGAAGAACGEIKPPRAPRVWLRLERSDKVETQNIRLAPEARGPWSVHYQVIEDDGWTGSGEAAAIVSLRAPGPEGKVSGSIAVCFADDAGSCVSGSFDAEPCPPSIDAPVRGALPPEIIPEQYAGKIRDEASATAAPAVPPAGKAP